MTSAAWERWQRLGWPTTRSEAWRNFSTRPLQEFALDGGIMPAGVVPDEVLAALPARRVVFVDGWYSKEYSDFAGAPGIEVTTKALPPLVGELVDVPDGGAPASAMAEPPIEVGEVGEVGEAAASLPGIDVLTPADGPLEALNTALLGDGVSIRVAAGVAAGTLHVVHLVTGIGTAHVRTIVRLDDGASLALGILHLGVSSFTATNDGPYFVNAVTELDVGAGARLAVGKCVREGIAASHLEAVHARVAANATLTSYTLSLGGLRVRTAVTATLAGAHAAAEVDGLYVGSARQKLDHVTDIRHAVPDTRSAQTWSGVLDQRAEGGFQGVIRIDRDAARSATRQLTRTLLLSNDAEAHARPELHIDCDDVTASHGATVGQLDALEQFYLESRGIPPDAARRMLIRAFVDRQLAVAPAALRTLFAAALDATLGPGATIEGDA